MERFLGPIESKPAAASVVVITTLLPVLAYLLAVPIIAGPVPLSVGVWMLLPLVALTAWSAVRIRSAIETLKTPLALARADQAMQAVSG